jgi:beta-lactamase class A
VTAEALVRELRAELDEGGLRGSFLVRDLRSGVELGIDPDREYAIASLVKVPLAAVTLERIRRGELDGATQLEVPPGGVTTPGPIGLTRFRHPARIAVDDLLYLSTCLSDGSAADVLFGLTPPAGITRMLGEWGLHGIAQAGAFTPKSTSPVCTVPAVRPGAVWYFQYRFVCAMTWTGGGAPYADRSSVVCASATRTVS